MRIVAGVTGALFGIGLGLQIGFGHFAPVALGFVLAGAVAMAARRLGRGGLEQPFVAVGLLAFALRCAVASATYFVSLTAGRGGYVTGDDGSYAALAYGFAQFLHGAGQAPYLPPAWNGDDYLFGPYVYLVSVLFFFLGPQVLVANVVNAALAALSVLLLADLGRKIFGTAPGLLAAALYALHPSLVLWSSINLKEALALFLIVTALWLTVRLVQNPRLGTLLWCYVPLVAMRGLRDYILFGFLVLIPLCAAVAVRARAEVRTRVIGGAIIASAVFLATFPLTMQGLVSGVVTGFESSRAANAVGARTSIYEIPPVTVRSGDTFVVLAPSLPSPSPAPSPASSSAPAPPSSVSTPPAPAPPPRVVEAGPGDKIVLAKPDQPVPSASAGVVYVQPGDLIVVGGGAPAASQKTLVLNGQPEQATARFGAEGEQARELQLARTLAYLPRGLAHALFAPLPWEARRAAELATVPEMLLWYLSVVAAVWTAWRYRERWPSMAPVVLFAVGLLGLLVLVEGNIGSLFRHRSMVVPAVLLLGAPGLLALARRLLVRRAPA